MSIQCNESWPPSPESASGQIFTALYLGLKVGALILSLILHYPYTVTFSVVTWTDDQSAERLCGANNNDVIVSRLIRY